MGDQQDPRCVRLGLRVEEVMNDEVQTQTDSGRWVPAIPVPYYRDARPWHVKVYHVVLVILGYDSDELMEPWWREER